jgi:hypothetical protein
LTIKEILEGKKGAEQIKNIVYLVYHGTDLFYIGKCEKMTLYDRFQLHIGKGHFHEIIKSKHQQTKPPQSKFSEALQKAAEKGMDWTVDILTLDECKKIFKENNLPLCWKLKRAERALIRLFGPGYNIQSHPDHKKPLPWLK